ncbi:hypothetical protein CGRA01v4_07389 [Colletotrichum graminicola]|nr:hypothetical protein CGRA01v4_07389 [Colletotrichum graminicola]
MLKRHVASFVPVPGCFDFPKGPRYGYGQGLEKVGDHHGAGHHARSIRFFRFFELQSVASVSFDDVAGGGTIRSSACQPPTRRMFEIVQMTTRLSSSRDNSKLGFHGELERLGR